MSFILPSLRVSAFVFQLLTEQKKFDDEMRRQLKLQSQVHADHLREALLVKEQETQRMLQHALSEQADVDAIKHKAQLAEVVGRSRAVAAALKGKYVSLYFLASNQVEKSTFPPPRRKCNRVTATCVAGKKEIRRRLKITRDDSECNLI